MAGKRKPQSFLVLNNIRSCENVGSLFRICDSCNIKLIIQGFTPHPKIEHDDRLPYIITKDTSKILKTALESLYNVPFMYIKCEEDVIAYLKRKNIHIYSLETGVKTSNNIFKYKRFNKPFALVVGNEKLGVSDIFFNNSVAILHIPMFGKNKSLNVAVSAAVALYNIILS